MDEQQEQEVIDQIVSDAEEEGEAKRPGFFARNFSYEHAWRRRLILDAIVGGILPPLMLVFDPGIFRFGDPCFGPAPTLAPLAIFAYVAVGMGVPVFLTWMVFRKRLPGVITAVFAGVMAAGVLFAAVLGIRMIPFTIVGLFIIIGVLGLTPFAVAYIYYRQARFAWEQARSGGISMMLAIVLMVVGAAAVLVPPAMAQAQVAAIVEGSVDAVVADPGAMDASVDRLQELNAVCPRVCEDMLGAYVWESYLKNQVAGDNLSLLVERVTGETVYLFDCTAV